MKRDKVVLTKKITVRRKKNGKTYRHYSYVGTPKNASKK